MEIALSNLLRGICQESFPSVAPFGTGPPYVVWQQVGGREVTTLKKKRVRRNSLVQITAWARTTLEAIALMDEIDAALRGTALIQASPVGARRMTHDAETKLHGQQQDWSIWS